MFYFVCLWNSQDMWSCPSRWPCGPNRMCANGWRNTVPISTRSTATPSNNTTSQVRFDTHTGLNSGCHARWSSCVPQSNCLFVFSMQAQLQHCTLVFTFVFFMWRWKWHYWQICHVRFVHKNNYLIKMAMHLNLTHCVRRRVYHSKCSVVMLSLLILKKPDLIHNIPGVLCSHCHLQSCHPVHQSVHPSCPTVSVATDNSCHVNHFPNEALQGHPCANDTPVRIATDDR